MATPEDTMSPGDRFGTNCGELWLCARRDLPDIAATFASANQAIGRAAGGESTFNQPGGLDGRTGAIWALVQKELQRLTAESATNLYDAGDALADIATRYAGTDDDARRQFERSYAGDPDNAPYTHRKRQNTTMP